MLARGDGDVHAIAHLASGLTPLSSVVQLPYSSQTLLASTEGAGIFTSADGGTTRSVPVGPLTTHGLVCSYSTL